MGLNKDDSVELVSEFEMGGGPTAEVCYLGLSFNAYISNYGSDSPRPLT